MKGCSEVGIEFDGELSHVGLRLFTAEPRLDLTGEGGKLEQDVQVGAPEAGGPPPISSSSGAAAVPYALSNLRQTLIYSTQTWLFPQSSRISLRTPFRLISTPWHPVPHVIDCRPYKIANDENT